MYQTNSVQGCGKHLYQCRAFTHVLAVLLSGFKKIFLYVVFYFTRLSPVCKHSV